MLTRFSPNSTTLTGRRRSADGADEVEAPDSRRGARGYERFAHAASKATIAFALAKNVPPHGLSSTHCGQRFCHVVGQALSVTRGVRIMRARGNRPFLIHSYCLSKPLAELVNVPDARQTPHGTSCIVGRQNDRANAEQPLPPRVDRRDGLNPGNLENRYTAMQNTLRPGNPRGIDDDSGERGLDERQTGTDQDRPRLRKQHMPLKRERVRRADVYSANHCHDSGPLQERWKVAGLRRRAAENHLIDHRIYPILYSTDLLVRRKRQPCLFRLRVSELTAGRRQCNDSRASQTRAPAWWHTAALKPPQRNLVPTVRPV